MAYEHRHVPKNTPRRKRGEDSKTIICAECGKEIKETTLSALARNLILVLFYLLLALYIILDSETNLSRRISMLLLSLAFPFISKFWNYFFTLCLARYKEVDAGSKDDSDAL